MRTDSAVHRAMVVGVLVVLALLAGVFDKPSTLRHPVAAPSEAAQLQVGAQNLVAPSATALRAAMPVASTPSAASTTWFCGGGNATAGDPLEATLLITNRATRLTQVIITPYGTSGSAAPKNVDVEAATTVTVPLSSFRVTGNAAATVESRGGGVTVSEQIGSGTTVSVAACATSSSDSWYFALGSTELGAKERLVLFNPFDSLVTADVAFITDDGLRQPQAVHGLAVPAKSVVVVDPAKVENRRADLSAIVTTRSGQLMVWRSQSFDGTGPKLPAGFAPRGVSVTLGSPEVLTAFALPTALIGQGVSSRVGIANPGAKDATVKLIIAPDDPATNGQPSAITLKVPAGTVAVVSNKELQQLPPGVPFTVSGTVTGGPVAVEMWLDGVEPAKGHGSFAVVAAPISTRMWVAMSGLSSPTIDQVAVQSAGRKATFTISVVAKGIVSPVRGKGVATEVSAGGRASVALASIPQASGDVTVVVRASAPVIVSRLQAGADTHGLISVLALPVVGKFFPPVS